MIDTQRSAMLWRLEWGKEFLGGKGQEFGMFLSHYSGQSHMEVPNCWIWSLGMLQRSCNQEAGRDRGQVAEY